MSAISDCSRDDRAMESVVLEYLTDAGPSGGQKRKGGTPMGGFGIGSLVNKS